MTSHDVATEAGVSQATVARVFASPEKVAEATRSNVRAAAKRLGYVPNAIARSLKAQRTDIVGAVVPATGEYWQHVLTTFSRQLNERRKQLLLFSFDDSAQVPRVLETVAQYQLDGLILASANIATAQMVAMSGSGLPVVAFNQPAAQQLIASVTIDNEAGMRLLGNHVAGCGVQSALFLGGDASTSTDQTRYRGAASALGDHGVACPYVEAGAFSYEAGYKAARTVGEQTLPDAIMVASDEVAFGLIDGLRQMQIEAPRDVLITGFDGLPQATWAAYDLTTLEQPTELLVEHAVETVLTTNDVLRDENDLADGALPSIVVPGTIRQGRTTDNSSISTPGSRRDRKDTHA